METPVKMCPKCGSTRLREILSDRTRKFVGYQCEQCFHWWTPKKEQGVI